MTQDDFNKAPLVEQILYDTTGMLAKNHTDIIEAMNKYHEAKLKLLGIADVSNRRELLIAVFEKMNRPQITMLEIGGYDKLADELLSNL